MTDNRRAKRDARAHKRATGDSYTQSRRSTSRVPRKFEKDHCANCLRPMPDDLDALFCSEVCRQTADLIRYWRGTSRDERQNDPDVKDAIKTRVAHLLEGGYHESARRLTDELKREVHARAGGMCATCGGPGEEIDHIDGDSNELVNLQLLCRSCRRAKTVRRMVSASAEDMEQVARWQVRVEATEPTLLCDDELEWRTQWRTLKAERQQRLLNRLADEEDGYDDDDMDYAGDPGNYDGGYGPSSYFSHAMNKDD